MPEVWGKKRKHDLRTLKKGIFFHSDLKQQTSFIGFIIASEPAKQAIFCFSLFAFS